MRSTLTFNVGNYNNHGEEGILEIYHKSLRPAETYADLHVKWNVTRKFCLTPQQQTCKSAQPFPTIIRTSDGRTDGTSLIRAWTDSKRAYKAKRSLSNRPSWTHSSYRCLSITTSSPTMAMPHGAAGAWLGNLHGNQYPDEPWRQDCAIRPHCAVPSVSISWHIWTLFKDSIQRTTTTHHSF